MGGRGAPIVRVASVPPIDDTPIDWKASVSYVGRVRDAHTADRPEGDSTL